MNTVEYTLPVYWASYLINSDPSGLIEGEQESIDAWCKAHNVGNCLDVSEDVEFRTHNDADSLGAECSTFTFETKCQK